MKIAILTTDNRECFRDFDASAPYFGTAPEALLQGFAEIPEAEVHVISAIRQPVRSPEKIAPNIWFHSLLVPRLGWTATLFQGCIRAAKRKLKELRPDIVHGQGTERDCALSAVFSGFPNVLTIHGNMRLIAELHDARMFSYRWMAAKLEKFTLPRSDGVVCITSYTQRAVAPISRKTWVLPNAVDGSFFAIQPDPDPARIVLSVGGITYRKNQNALIKSLDSVAAKIKFKLVFLGAGDQSDPYYQEFLSLVAARPWCEFGGFASREKLKDWLKRATAVVLPSLEDNCPMVVLEGMAAGVPVLAANVGGVPDLVDNGRTGLYCDPTDPATMAAGMERLLAETDFARGLATAAKQEARKRFQPLAVARAHMEIYAEVLKGRR